MTLTSWWCNRSLLDSGQFCGEEGCNSVEKLSKAATNSPQAASTALSKSLQCEWSYLQRVIYNCGGALSHCKMQFLKLSTQHCSKEQMLNVNFFRYQPMLLAWGSIILLKHYHTSTQGTMVSCGRSY